MTEDLSIQRPQATPEQLAEWYKLQQDLDVLKEKEMELRKLCFGTFFPSPVEGTNNFVLPDGYMLKGKHTINRSLDEGEFDARREEFRKLGIAVDDIVIQRPTFVLSVYRELTEEQANMFDTCLIVRPGSPGLEITQPKKRGKKAVNS